MMNEKMEPTGFTFSIERNDQTRIQEICDETFFISEVNYPLVKSKKCFIGFSAARGFVPALRITGHNEKISFSFDDWCNFIQYMNFVDDFFREGDVNIVRFKDYNFQFLTLDGTRFVQVIHFTEVLTCNKSQWESLVSMSQLLYNHLLVLNMRNFID